MERWVRPHTDLNPDTKAGPPGCPNPIMFKWVQLPWYEERLLLVVSEPDGAASIVFIIIIITFLECVSQT